MIATALPFVLGVVFAVWFPARFVLAARAAGATIGAGTAKIGARDRLTLLDAAATALFGVLFSWLFLPWNVVPPVLWSVPVALTTYGVIVSAVAWGGLPWVAQGRRTWAAATGSAIAIVMAGAAAVLVLA